MSTAVVPPMPCVVDPSRAGTQDEDKPRLTLAHLLHPEDWDLPDWNGPR